MLSFRPWYLPILSICLVASAQESGNDCCNLVRQKLPPIVHFPSSPEYNTRHSTYYSLQQQELFPACTVRPNSASDVSLALQIAEANQCPFAVASGGHMSWKGSSNIDGRGFVIDLTALNMVDISAKDQTVKLGPGSPWTNVYAAMSPFNITTTGARINDVGVGGFLLGGGIAFASMTRGFGSDNVFNYETVLSNGSIINVNKDSHPDLFWALKLAGSNYGIVTRFDMHTYASPEIWGSVVAYPVTPKTKSDLLAAFEQYGHDNRNDNLFLAVVFGQSSGSDLISAVQVTLDGTPMGQLTSVAPIVNSEKVGPTHDVVDEVIAAVIKSTARTAWYTITTEVDSELFVEIYEEARRIFEPLTNISDLSWTIGLQSIQKSFIEGAAGTPVYNALARSKRDLVCVLLLATWSDPKDDIVMRDTVNSLGAWAEANGRKRGTLDDFIYLNYANGLQHVYERSVTAEDLDKMRHVQMEYDPLGTLEKLWKGGWKLPKKDSRVYKKDEL